MNRLGIGGGMDVLKGLLRFILLTLVLGMIGAALTAAGLPAGQKP